MIPWLMIIELMSQKNLPLSQLVADRIEKFPASGEINRVVKNSAQVIEMIRQKYEPYSKGVDHTDGLSLDMGEWRFNLRESNTEPVIRLNVESRGAIELMEEKTAELLMLIEPLDNWAAIEEFIKAYFYLEGHDSKFRISSKFYCYILIAAGSIPSPLGRKLAEGQLVGTRS